MQLNNKNKLLELMSQGAVVITPNNRLSADLERHYFKSVTRNTLDKPRCQPYSMFLTQSYNQLKRNCTNSPFPLLLNNIQSRHLWQKIIKDDTEITYSEGLLAAIVQAWEYCTQWDVDPKHSAFKHNTQTERFQLWWHHFNKHLDTFNLITEQQISSCLIKEPLIKIPHTLIWVCFDGFTPQQVRLQSYFTANEVTQYFYDLPQKKGITEVVAAQDNKEEYDQLFLWLKQKIRLKEPRIGVVIPNLQQESRTVHRLFSQHFDVAEYNISLGQPLIDFPIIAHALNWLAMSTDLCTQQQAQLLLQSPYTGSAKEEFLARSHYMQDSALLQERSFPLHSFINDVNPFAPNLAILLRTLTPYPEETTPHQWVTLFQERLNTIGFPGSYGLNSQDYQCFNRFSTVFDEFRQLQIISKSLSLNQALAAFTDLLKNTIFQAQKINAPIQISGLLEASGCEFDSLWVMGLTNQCLPQKTHLSAFIPHQLQRDLGMPHSSPGRELQFAQQTLLRLQRGSSSTVFSYARLQGDSPELPCSLIADYPLRTLEPLDKSSTNYETHLDALLDNYLIAPTPDEPVHGGTALLGSQAKCPFKAFAQYRLNAKSTPETTDGLDNKEKGKIIHKVMELIWGTLQNQEKLLRMNAAAIEQLIDTVLYTVLNPLNKEHPESFPELIQDVEFTRLKRLVMICLEWEKQRPAFAVEALEKSYTIDLAGLNIKMRIDRLDTVGSKKWVIDYKSSLPVTRPWNEDRPKEPQLLLYTLLDEDIDTMLLMQIKTGRVQCLGLSEQKLDIKGLGSLKKDELWSDLRESWYQQLLSLAEEIQQGHCQPQPASMAICQQCDFKNLCRI